MRSSCSKVVLGGYPGLVVEGAEGNFYPDVTKPFELAIVPFELSRLWRNEEACIGQEVEIKTCLILTMTVICSLTGSIKGDPLNLMGAKRGRSFEIDTDCNDMKH